MGYGYDSEDQHKSAAYIVDACRSPWIELS